MEKTIQGKLLTRNEMKQVTGGMASFKSLTNWNCTNGVSNRTICAPENPLDVACLAAPWTCTNTGVFCSISPCQI